MKIFSFFTILLTLLALSEPVVHAKPIDPTAEAMEEAIRKEADGAFELLPLEYDSSGKATIHFIDPAAHSFIYDGKRFFGFRFRTPDEIAGTFSWMFLMRNADGPKTIGGMGWYILRKNGSMTGFSHYIPASVSEYPDLQSRFPYTRGLTLQTLPKSSFLPKEEYIIWFSTLESEKTAQFAVSFSFVPPGSDLLSKLPLGPHAEHPKGPDTRKSTRQSAEGDPW